VRICEKQEKGKQPNINSKSPLLRLINLTNSRKEKKMKRQSLFQTCITILLLAGSWLSEPALAGWHIETADSTGSVGIEGTSLALDSNANPHISYWDEDNEALKYAAFNGSTWDIQTIDNAADDGDWSSIALDTNDNPHISYQGNNSRLKYAAFNGLTWDIETVDSTFNVGTSTSLVLDSNDNPHISYHYWPDENLNYAYFCGYVPGDLNDDCKVDFRDFAIFGLAWYAQPGDAQWNPYCDISDPNDNIVDVIDLDVFCDNWLAEL
jgi:hypothetical protein